jgi:hypothetical protein
VPKTPSEAFAVGREDWAATGAFDAFVGVDARLHIDPHLIGASSAPEFNSARVVFDAYFKGVMTLLKTADSRTSPFFRRAVKKLTFKEIPSTGLGYSKEGRSGSGIGPKLAGEIAALGKAIVDEGIVEPEIFDLMGLLQDNIGADRISDMTAAIIVENILGFTDRVAKCLDLNSVTLARGDRAYRVPVLPGTQPQHYLVPVDILRHLPVATCWSDIDSVTSHNADQRNRANAIIGDTWKKATREQKREIRRALLENPGVLEDLLNKYKGKPKKSYDISSDPDLLILWNTLAREAASSSPLDLTSDRRDSFDDFVALVRKILTRFKQLVESNRIYRLFYNDDGTPRREKAAQLALFGIADAYCAANNVDLSPETDSGVGPVDFKFSTGYKARILAEIKLSTNSKLLAGFEQQVKAYTAAEQAFHAFYVVVRIHDSLKSVNALVARVNQLKAANIKAPELVIIDARPTESASKR